ncbi:MAG: hypothetical protein C0483_16135 [Pirellula sp.]|nr:hypothetical protein [Pirellula sp.]
MAGCYTDGGMPDLARRHVEKALLKSFIQQWLTRCALLSACFVCSSIPILSAAEPSTSLTSAEFFARRILPIAQAQRASSCTECHFSGVELKQYVLADEASTFAALRAAGLIDVVQPDKSKLLQFIARKPEREDPALARVRTEELAAFQGWIAAAASNPALLASSPTAQSIGTELPLEVIRHARRDHVLNAFIENVWVEMERCVNCHSPERNERFRKEHGEQVSWITPRDPAATLKFLADQGLIDVDAPEKSLLLSKPLGIVEHAGHVKFAVGSRTDRQFRSFLNDYAAAVQGKYRKASELPKPGKEIAIATGQHLRVTDLPLEFGGRLMRVLLFRRDGESWSKHPIATGDSGINPKNGQWQNSFCELVDRANLTPERLTTPRLLPGERYLAKIYIDRENRAADNPAFEFMEADLYAEIETAGDWQSGYLKPKILSAKEKASVEP